MRTSDTETTGHPGSALESAIEDIERSVRADGEIHGGIPDGELAGYEWRALFRWAERAGYVFPPEVGPERQGGREHDLTFLPQERRWLKFTKPDGCGLTVEMVEGNLILLPATPLQYFRRLQRQNQVWDDDTRLVGVQVKRPGARIVTTQPDIPGEPPSMDDLHECLCGEFGFRRLDVPPMGYYKSASYLRGNIGMFDVHPANFVQVASGLIVPIDVIMIEFEEADLRKLGAK